MAQETADRSHMRQALRLARRGYGATSPNPMVGALLVRDGQVLGQGWHHAAGRPHAEIEALRHAQKQGHSPAGATLYVTLEPCCTHGRTPPCTEAILQAGITRVVVAATDPNPAHSGHGFTLLRQRGVEVTTGVLEQEATELNTAFNHWIVQRQPWVLAKSAMTLDGKIATTTGESKWITGVKSRALAMRLRRGADAILVGINTVLADDPQLSIRPARARPLRRLVLDAQARTPLEARVASDAQAAHTTIIVSDSAPAERVAALSRQVTVWQAPLSEGRIDLPWLLERLGREGVQRLMVEGGGEAHASFFEQRLVHEIAFFYAPKIMGGAGARKAVAGMGAQSPEQTLTLHQVRWRQVGEDLLLTARVG